jgi:P63C domain
MLGMADDTENESKKEAGRIGGIERAKALTDERKKEIAKKAARARWGAPATHKGNFKEEFGVDVDCYVLDDEQHTAVISQTGIGVSLGLSARGSSFPRFLATQGMSGALGAELEGKIKNPLKFQWVSPGAQQTGGVATVHGYDVTVLIDVCKAIIKADADGRLRNEKIAKQAAIIIGASAKSGIQGLVYKLAGYDATKEEVIAAFKRFVQQEAREYEREFPQMLYSEWYRLYQLPKPERGRPWKAKHLTIDHVYHPLARSNGKVLKLTREQKAAGGSRGDKLHQFLSEIGVKALRTHLGQVLGVARISKNQEEYEKHIDSLFGVQVDWIDQT